MRTRPTLWGGFADSTHMTIFHVTGAERSLTVRYVPVLAWSFIVFAVYGIGDILTRLLDGRTPADPGTALGLALLIGLAIFVLYSGGQFVVASFDGMTDTVRIVRYGLQGRTLIERRLSEVIGLDVRVLRRAQHRVELRLSSGERLPLTPYYVVSFTTSGLERLGAFLNMEPTLIRERRR